MGPNVSLPPQPSPYLRKDFTAAKPIAAARACTSPRSASTRSASTAARSARRCSRPAGRSTPSASRARPTTSRTCSERRQRDRRDPRRGLVRRPPAGRAQVGHQPRAARPAEDHLRRRDQHPRRPPTTPGRPAAAACRPRASTTARPTTPASTSPAGTSPASRRLAERGRAHRDDGGGARARRRRSASSSTLQPKTLTQPKPGTYIFDLGQNFAGWARLPSRAPRDHGQAALRRDPQPATARSTPPTCAPRSRPTPTRCAGRRHRDLRAALHLPRLPLRRGHRVPRHPDARLARRPRGQPDLPEYGTFTIQQPAREQIQSAIRWGQRSNFLAVPSDASQRDERLGWTGDIQAFASTGAFNGDAQRLPRPVAADAARLARPRPAPSRTSRR